MNARGTSALAARPVARRRWIGLACCAGVALGGCGSDARPDVAEAGIVSIQVTPASVTIDLCGRDPPFQQFTATGIDSQGVSRVLGPNEVLWRGGEPMVAVVDWTGFAVGLAEGVVSIDAVLASNTAISGHARVELHWGDVIINLVLAPREATISVGEQLQASVVAQYCDNRRFELETGVTWRSSEPTVAIVNDHGTITGVAAGSTQIRALTAGERFSDTILVTVSDRDAGAAG